MPGPDKFASPTITLHVSPSKPSFFLSTAVIICLAFSGAALIRWWAATPDDEVIADPEHIPSRRLHRTIRVNARRELAPDTMVVTALLKDEVVGVAVWNIPKRLWRTETVMQSVYRRLVGVKDAIEDLVWPISWYRTDVKEMYYKKVAESMERILGPEYQSNTWYLSLLAVHPTFQRKGVGSALVDWALKQARDNGERVYVEATQEAKSFYLAKGFTEVEELVFANNAVIITCMFSPAP